MKKIILQVLGISLFAQPDKNGNVAAILTKPSPSNPSANGVHTINEGQLRRIVTRSLGVFSPVGFKHIIDTCNGSAKLTIDMEDCKSGDTYKKRNGETGTYTKDWTKYSNHEVQLGVVGSMKLAELSLASAFQAQADSYAYVAPKKAIVEAEEAKTEEAPKVD